MTTDRAESEPRADVSLARLTSLKIGGPADWYADVFDPDAAAQLLRWAAQRELACRWLGGGTNLLIADAGLAGLAARYRGDELRLPSPTEPLVVAGAGRSFPNLARQLARRGWGGLEWAANVPGSVGGAVVNNAGAFGSCVAETLAWAEAVGADGRARRLLPTELDYAYRTSRLKRGELGSLVVLRAALRVAPRHPDEAVAIVQEHQQHRTATQPRLHSAGSVFANPPGDYSGRLIEAVGLKGRRLGAAQISSQHANFIVNHGGACAADVYGLIRTAQDRVWSEFATWLTPEIELIGRWTEAERAALRQPTGLEGAA